MTLGTTVAAVRARMLSIQRRISEGASKTAPRRKWIRSGAFVFLFFCFFFFFLVLSFRLGGEKAMGEAAVAAPRASVSRAGNGGVHRRRRCVLLNGDEHRGCSRVRSPRW